MAEELRPLEILEERFTRSAEEIGGRVLNFLVSPGRREVFVIVELDDDMFLDPDAKTTKDKFDDIMANFSVYDPEAVVKGDDDEAVASDLEDLARRLGDPDEGIL